VRAFAWFSLCVASAPLLAVIFLGQPGLSPMLHTPAWIAASLRTLLIAKSAVPIALLLAVPAALVLWGAPRVTRRGVIAVCALPLLVPPSWSASGLELAADRSRIEDAHVVALIAAHAAPAAALAFLVLYGLMRFADPALLRVAATNGASPLQAWCIVVLPHLAVAIAVAGAAAFAGVMGLAMIDTALTPALHPTLGSMVAVAVRTADSQAAPAGLILTLLALAPLGFVLCLSLLRRL